MGLKNVNRQMNISIMKGSLSPQRKQLLEEMQYINFGRIKDLFIQDGEPFFNQNTRIVRDIKYGGKNDPRPELNIRDFALKDEVVEFFKELDRFKEGRIECIVIKHGLPFQMSVEERLSCREKN